MQPSRNILFISRAGVRGHQHRCGQYKAAHSSRVDNRLMKPGWDRGRRMPLVHTVHSDTDIDRQRPPGRPQVDQIRDSGSFFHTFTGNGSMFHRSRWKNLRWKFFRTRRKVAP